MCDLPSLGSVGEQMLNRSYLSGHLVEKEQILGQQFNTLIIILDDCRV